LILAGAAAALAIAGEAAAQTYDYTKIDVPGSNDTVSQDINDSGAVTGYSGDNGFIYSDGTYTTLRVDDFGSAINDSGEVLIASAYRGSDFYGYLYSARTYTRIKYPRTGSKPTYGLGLNGTGEVAGYYEGAKGVYSGFVFSGGAYTRIVYPGSHGTTVAGIDASGDVAGSYTIGRDNKSYGFIDSGGAYTTINAPGSKGTTVIKGMSASGAVWGDYDDGKHVFVYSGGTYTPIDVAGSTGTTVTGVNASGVVVGYYVSGSTDYGFVDDGGTYTTIDVSGSTNTYVEGINNSGQLTGYYSTYSSSTGVADYGFIATPQAGDMVMTRSAVAAVPEPSTWALLLAGFAGLGIARCRKARSGRTAGSPT
jgi:hypothetical protein